ncbi:MAG: TetR/AcrR family transcriptional regulator [Thermocrispum sp.]
MTTVADRAGRPRRPRDRKEQLAAVAAELFCQRGYHEVGITDIAAAAGITGPALYRHFNDKQAILAHVVLLAIEQLTATTQLSPDGAAAPAPDQVDTMLHSLARLSVERRDISALWRWERRNLSAEAQREVRHRSTELVAGWTRTLRAARPELSEPDAAMLCWAGLSVFGSVAVHSTRLSRRRYVDLLVAAARGVVHRTLPEPGAPAAQPPTPVLQPSRREVLVIEASRLFGERGFHEVSMEDIGSAAGISGPSVYRHFPSKTAVFMAAASRVAERLAAGRARVAATAATELEALRGLVRSYVETMVDSADLMSVGREIRALSEADRTELRRVQRDYVAEWVRLLVAVRPDLTPVEARVVVHMGLTIVNDLIRTGPVMRRENLAEELAVVMATALGIACWPE